ncbi:MAG TPA: aryl-sulfate sulfotransferase [Ignavibacteria bacterium]|nr:aryl-sulfate sulfotransferase [Ignavibacteria bacterium]HMR40339.1 aryl-sulfate sulfotransferase [Ignavibacteria bacterium]
MKTYVLFLFLLSVCLKNAHADVVYTDPVKNAAHVSIDNGIILTFDGTILNSPSGPALTVTGSVSGVHSGETVITPDRKSLLFKPYHPFEFNETVSVNLSILSTSRSYNNNVSYSFQTEKKKIEFDAMKYFDEEDPSYNKFVTSDNYSSLPAPPLTPVIYNNPTSGLIYTNNFKNFYNKAHLLIANENGSYFFTREEVNQVLDFKRQPNGVMTYFSRDRQKYFSMDNDYNITDSFYCGNGYSTDIHDLQFLANGNYLIMSYDPQPVDMSQIVPGGNTNAIVTGLIVQEIDPDRNVVFQWRSWDHFNITDANHIDLTDSLIDYVHGNAVEQDDDGNILISCRHMSEITKINRATGDIIWRLGGINNEFTFPNDSIEISYQHDIRRIDNGNITIFDNGNFHSTLFSRAVEYQLDEINKTATLVWEYRNSPDIYGNARGSAQRLENGNTLIFWGASSPGTFSEVTPEGEIRLELSFEPGIGSYRGFFEILDIDLDLKIAIEGFYDNANNILNMSDTATVFIRNIAAPFDIIDTSIAVIDSLTFTGNFKLKNTPTGDFYITVKHRNSLETWSKAGGESFTNGSSVSYDMTDNSSKAFGNNLVQVNSSPDIFALYSGDVVNDDFIELSDVIYTFNDAVDFAAGYIDSDLNGNNIAGLADVLIASNNSILFVGTVTP